MTANGRQSGKVTAIALSGPILGGIGWYFGIPTILWLGFAVCWLNLLLRAGTKVSYWLLLPLASMVAGGLTFEMWFEGVAYGLIVYTALECTIVVSMRLFGDGGNKENGID